MKWFDKQEIKNQNHLTAEETSYLLEPSLSVVVPFNCIFRRHFDYLLAFIMLLGGEILLSLPKEIGIISAVYLLINTFLQIWLLYFFIKYGRRLAWNRNQWKDIETFKKSEKKWLNFIIPSIVLMAIRFYQNMQKELDPEAKMIIGCTVIFFGCAIVLPFLQTWHTKKKKKNILMSTTQLTQSK